MKLYYMKVAIPGKDGSTIWRNIGTVFADDSANLQGPHGKALGFAIDYPAGRGIIVPAAKDTNQKGSK